MKKWNRRNKEYKEPKDVKLNKLTMQAIQTLFYLFHVEFVILFILMIVYFDDVTSIQVSFLQLLAMACVLSSRFEFDYNDDESEDKNG